MKQYPSDDKKDVQFLSPDSSGYPAMEGIGQAWHEAYERIAGTSS